eukprot:700822-Rhodomonas_salina.2
MISAGDGTHANRLTGTGNERPQILGKPVPGYEGKPVPGMKYGYDTMKYNCTRPYVFCLHPLLPLRILGTRRPPSSFHGQESGACVAVLQVHGASFPLTVGADRHELVSFGRQLSKATASFLACQELFAK